jgi:hypothetical protein
MHLLDDVFKTDVQKMDTIYGTIMPYVFVTFTLNIKPRVSMPLLCVNLVVGAKKIFSLLVHIFVQPTTLILFILVTP